MAASMTMSAAPPTIINPCPSCGKDRQSLVRRSDYLETQVQLLTEQSMAAATKLANYEEEIHRLRSAQKASAVTSPTITTTSTESATAAESGQSTSPHAHSQSLDGLLTSSTTAARPTALTRFASFTLGSGASATKAPLPTPNGSVNLSDLQRDLARERAARGEAERKVDQANDELEDLSAQLFEEANEMVATERRARSKLEERIVVLEQRDKEKSKRLERIEGALKRLERVKALLGT